MLKRWVVIVLATVIFVVGLWLYLSYRVPPGIEPQDGEESKLAWISLAVSLVGLATASIGLIQKVIELRATKDA